MPYTDPGSTAVDDHDGAIAVTITGESAVNTAVPGNYTVVHTATDSGTPALTTTVTRDVNVVANGAPSIVLSGANPVQLVEGTPYVEAGFTATDDNDGVVTGNVTVTGAVDHTTPGTYTLSYTVADAQGLSTTVTRTVNVLVNLAPVITLAGANPDTVVQGT